MKICELDKELKGVIENHSVYGAECIINSLVRACKNEKYLNAQSIHTLVESAFGRLSEDQEDD
ncbi:MAG: hypothetical protein J6S67_14215 [Methanobrevibacter sp.]|nr:hypothetical protein [Methanobrevibacter sp.]